MTAGLLLTAGLSIADVIAHRQALAQTSDLLDQLRGRKGAAKNAAAISAEHPGTPFLEGPTVTVARRQFTAAELRPRSAMSAASVQSSQVDVSGAQVKDGFVGLVVGAARETGAARAAEGALRSPRPACRSCSSTSSTSRCKPLPSGNPLWSVPLSVLAATQDRPVFSASRRPPQRAVAAPFVEQVALPVPQKAAEPERPPLTLIGAVVGDSDAIAVFLDQTSQKIVSLHQGDSHAGWELGAVLQREVTLKKADQTEVLALQRAAVAAGAPGIPVAPVPAVPAAGGTDTSYAPFVPRSTPKNGESDGL